MKIKILSVSDSDKHFASAIEEYVKRLGKDVEIQTLKPEKNGTRQQIIGKETEAVIKKLDKDKNYKILLSKDGKHSTTDELVGIMSTHNNVTFLIGGPYGFDEAQLDKIVDMKLAFGKITLPHGLAKLTVLEQVYRVKSIMDGKEYHY